MQKQRSGWLVGAFMAFADMGEARASASDWPQWRGANYDGVRTLPLVSKDCKAVRLTKVWEAEAGVGFSSLAVAEERVFTMGNRDDTDTVWCYDANTGAVLWKQSYACALDPLYYEGGPGGTPTVAQEAVFTLSKKGHAHALDRTTGRMLWKRDLVADHGLKLPEWSFAASPFLAGDLVILNVGESGLALRRDTGATAWRTGTAASGYATPVPIGNNAAAIFRAQAISAVKVSDGSMLWDVEWKSSRDVNAADPLVHAGQILVSSTSGTALLGPVTTASEPPKELWKTRYRSYFNPPVRIGDFVYGIDGTTHRPTRLVCFEWATGKERWAVNGFGSGGLVAADDVLIICDKGEIIIARASPEGFMPLAREAVLTGKCWTAPAVAGDRVYARNAAGNVVCVEVAEEK
jgi:outer membrane protein assembly factor BamB